MLREKLFTALTLQKKKHNKNVTAEKKYEKKKALHIFTNVT